jgi:hypothetical protein
MYLLDSLPATWTPPLVLSHGYYALTDEAGSRRTYPFLWDALKAVRAAGPGRSHRLAEYRPPRGIRRASEARQLGVVGRWLVFVDGFSGRLVCEACGPLWLPFAP